jgi:uncharacterized protein (DUF1501 family)
MLSRRDFIHRIGGAACVPMFLDSMAAQAAGDSDTIVVAIAMNGGNDGLNTVIPLTQYGAYFNLRTPASPPPGLALAYTQADLAATAFDASPATPAASATQFAFAPGMTAMRNLYADGNLAVIAGVGLPPAETNALSHSNAWNDWMTGQININLTAGLPPGWMGLTLDSAKTGQLGPTASLSGSQQIIVGKKHPGLVVGSVGGFDVSTSASDNNDDLRKAFADELKLSTASAPAAYDQAVALSATQAVREMQAINARTKLGGYAPQLSYLDNQLYNIAQLILGGSGMRGYLAVQYGYDTHSAQNSSGYHQMLLAQLGYSMSAFYRFLKARKASSNVVIITISDFGRRPEANLDFGTDHGAGTVGFVLGDRVKGGVYGDYPSLHKFDPNGNLVVKVDFRNMLADVVTFMGGSPMTVLGHTYPKLGFL